jgi:2'-5' RNA ligase
MLRTFIAFDIDDRMRKECEYLILKGKKLFPKEIKWSEPANLHITFLFLGDVEQADIQVIKDLLQPLAEEMSAISLKNGQLRWNPPFKPQVVWIEFGMQNVECGIREQGDLESGLLREESKKPPRNDEKTEFGLFRKTFISKLKEKLPYLKLDNKDFKWHLTLGRIKNKINIEKWMLHNEVFNSDVSISQISLYQSILYPQGPVYKNLALFPLASG